ncbi:hypothetical protein KFK09_016014 [Dendrobium nobile]|uniref:Uncharacterized protein n=1 Tax=Dendrobium nobile TaxID=94219 RepID=A0A8T3B643_DENNO|nr:hypothetical protein KFK09_016014 [Dendrobium nobile]
MNIESQLQSPSIQKKNESLVSSIFYKRMKGIKAQILVDANKYAGIRTNIKGPITERN